MVNRAAVLFLLAFTGVAQAQFLTPVTARSFEAVFGPPGTPPVPFFNQVPAVNYDLGGQGVAYSVPVPGCSGSGCSAAAVSYRQPAGDDINFKSSTFGSGITFQLSYNVSPVAYNYTININQQGPYIITLWTGSPSTGGSWNAYIDNQSIGNILTQNTGSYSTLAASSSPSFNATIGTHVLRLAWASGDSLGSAGDLVAWQGGPATTCPCLAGNTPNICVNPTTAAANQPISVSWACGPSDTKSYFSLINSVGFAQAGQTNTNSGSLYWAFTNGMASGAATIPAPNAKVDRDEQWLPSLEISSGAQVALGTPFTVTKSINPPAPTATLPASVSADPFTPAHTNTVCASGCDFTDLGSAVHNAHVNNWDFVKINISAGDYPNPQFAVPTFSEYPLHLWIRGISPDGKTFAHISGAGCTSCALFQTVNVTTAGTGVASLTLDNLEIGPWGGKALIPGDSTSWTLRNVYVHDTLDGLESGNNWDTTVNFYNVVFARNGGGSGPDHNVYVGSGNLNVIVNVLNSVFEQANLGHSFKTRAKHNNLTCSMFLLNADNVYLGSQDIDFDWGEPIINKSLLVQGNGAGPAWNNQNSWDNLKFAVDDEAGRIAVPLDYNFVVTNSNLVNDQNNTVWPTVLGARFTGPNPVPAVWSGNKFVWANPSSQYLADNGVTADGSITVQHTGNIVDVNESANNAYTSWSAAGFGVTPNAEPYGWRDLLPMMPSGCTDPVGLVKIPAS